MLRGFVTVSDLRDHNKSPINPRASVLAYPFPQGTQSRETCKLLLSIRFWSVSLQIRYISILM